MEQRPYYSTRTGKSQGKVTLDLPMLKKLVLNLVSAFVGQQYFEGAFGYYCCDRHDVMGSIGQDMGSQMFLSLRREGLYPIASKIDSYTEEDLFDVIEFVFDHISIPSGGWFHGFENQTHYSQDDSTFDYAGARAEFRAKLNPLLADYGQGFELDAKGQIVRRPASGFERVMGTKVRHKDERVVDKVEAAKLLFSLARSDVDDRKNAVRDLAGVLERLRPEAKKVLLHKDEQDLFELANNFGIRHDREGQKTEYDEAVWLSWMFYHYLASINACTQLIARQQEGPK